MLAGGLDLGDRSGVEDLSLFDDGDAVADALDDVDDMAREEDFNIMRAVSCLLKENISTA